MKIYAVVFFSASLLMAGLLSAAVDCGTSLQTLTVATSATYPPFESIGTNGNLMGYDIDVACELRKRLGFAKIQFKNVTPFDFPTFVAGLNNGAFTIAISAISMTAPNLAQACAVKYNDDNQGFLYTSAMFAQLSAQLPPDQEGALANPATALRALSDLGEEEDQFPVGVPRGSYEESVINAKNSSGRPVYPGLMAVPMNDVASAVVAVNSNVVVTYFANAAVVTSVVAPVVVAPVVVVVAAANDPLIAVGVGTTANPVFIDPTAVGVTSLGLGIFMNCTCCQLYANILAAIAAMAADGTLAALQAKWGTGTFTPLSAAQQATITPTGCANTMANLVTRCAILQFAFDKFCPCTTAVAATIPAGSIM